MIFFGADSLDEKDTTTRTVAVVQTMHCFCFYTVLLRGFLRDDRTLTLCWNIFYFSGAIQQREKLSTSAQKAAKEAEARVSAEISKMKQQLADKDKELNVSGGLALFLFSLHPYSRLFMNVAWPGEKKIFLKCSFFCVGTKHSLSLES